MQKSFAAQLFKKKKREKVFSEEKTRHNQSHRFQKGGMSVKGSMSEKVPTHQTTVWVAAVRRQQEAFKGFVTLWLKR